MRVGSYVPADGGTAKCDCFISLGAKKQSGVQSRYWGTVKTKKVVFIEISTYAPNRAFARAKETIKVWEREIFRCFAYL